MEYSNYYGYQIRRAYCLNITSQKDVYIAINEISPEKIIPSHFHSKANQDLIITKCIISKKENKGIIDLISYKKLR